MADQQPDGAAAPTGTGSRGLEIYTAGLNAHSQLSPNHSSDIRAFQPLQPDSSKEGDIDIFFAGWSTTVLSSPTTLRSLGHRPFHEDWSSASQPLRPYSGIGDHNGLVAFLSDPGVVYWARKTDLTLPSALQRFMCSFSDDSPRIGLIAMAGNERVALTFKQAPNGRLCHVVEFEDFDKALGWYRDPSAEGAYPNKHHMLPGRPKQLIANTASFLLLMEDGGVYSWGDPRHQSLGRVISGEGAVPADKPGIIEALGGLRISKVASGGWMGAALSEDGALYLWGAGAPGAEKSIKPLKEAGAGEVALVELSSATKGGEPSDVADVAVGDGHIAAVADDGRLFVIGDNKNGQLGLDSEEIFFEDWTEATILSGVRRVVCGPKASFAFAASSRDLPS